MKTYTFLLAILVLLFSSCKNKTSTEAQIDFLINESSIYSLGEEYSEEDLELYKNDPDKVFYTATDSQIEIQANEDAMLDGEVSWYLNEKPWEDPVANSSKFTTKFEVPGLYKITMSSRNGEISKFIRAIERKEQQEDSVFEESEDDAFLLDFVTDIEKPNKWQAILFTDISNIGETIKRRVWDFGDGTVIPTIGPSVKYSYSKSGAFKVKLCVNLSEKCVSKLIVVDGSDAMKEIRDPKLSTKKKDAVVASASNENKKSVTETIAKTSKKEEASSASKPEKIADKPNEENTEEEIVLNDIDFSAPSSCYIGIPVRLQDMSSPNEAIKYRNWYINGEAQNFHQKTVDMIFDESGNFEIKMCLNYLSKNCVTKTIKVKSREQEIIAAAEEKSNRQYSKNNLKPVVGVFNVPPDQQSPTPEFEPMDSTTPSSEFYCQSYGKAGLKSEYKCTVDKGYFNGVSSITLEPSVDMELHTAKMYGNEMGYVDIILSSEDQKQVGVLKRVQILPGQTTIELTELAMTLQAGKVYEMVVSTLPQRSRILEDLALLNSNKCVIPSYDDNNLTIDYKNAMIMYDIKYCY